MFSVLITEKGGEQRRVDFDKSEVTIGRVQGNDIILAKGNVSKRHSRIVLKDGKFIVVDLKSTNGTYVNGRKISSPLVIRPSDKIYIGDFILGVEESGVAVDFTAAPPSAPESIDERKASSPRRSPPPVPKRPDPSGEDAGDGAALASSLAEAMPSLADVALPEAMPGLPPLAPSTEPASASAIEDAPPTGPTPVRPVPMPPREVVPESKEGRAAPPARKPPPLSTPPMRDATPAVASESARPAPPVRKPSLPPTGRVPTEIVDRSRPRPVAGSDRALSIQREIGEQVADALNLGRLDPSKLADEALWQRAERGICDIVERMTAKGDLPGGVDQEKLIQRVLDEALGLGPLEDLLADASVTQVFVSRTDPIFVDRGHGVVATAERFSSEKAVAAAIERMAPRRTGDGSVPGVVEARLPDGASLTAVLPPVSARGPSLVIRKPSLKPTTLEQLVERQALSPNMSELLSHALRARRNVLVADAGYGNAERLLSALGAALPPEERVVSVEQVGLLDFRREGWVALEAQPPKTGLRELILAAMRLRPSRLVVGRILGAEASQVAELMGGGFAGTLCGIAAPSAREAVSRLATLVESGGVSEVAARKLVAGAVNLVVTVVGLPDGGLRVTEVAEAHGPNAELHDVFAWKEEGDAKGGRFVPCGYVPRFFEDLSRQGVAVNLGIFGDS